MSMQITVNGKFGSSYKRSILQDPERVKKDLENERRITRLQQVREKSKNLARKIRQDVADEKERQIQKLEHIKQQELNAWRQHVLVKKHQDYRSSIFQVGAAHRAAHAENKMNEVQKQQREDKIRTCRRQAVKRACKPNVRLQRSPAGKDYNCEGRASVCTQTHIPEPTIEDNENRLKAGSMPLKTCNTNTCKVKQDNCTAKRKRRTCCSENPACYCQDSDDEFLSETLDSSNDLEESDDESVTELSTDRCQNNLRKTPPVILDVDDDNDDPLAETHGTIEIHDKFIQSNRQFSRVVHPSPVSNPERQRSPLAERAPKRFTQISDFVRRNTQPDSTMQNEEVPALEPEPQVFTSRSPNHSPTRTITETPRSPIKTAPTAAKSPVRKAAPSKSPIKPAKSPRSSTLQNRLGNSRNPQQQAPKRSTLKKSSEIPTAKVIDAGIQPKSSVQATATAIQSKEGAVSQPVVGLATQPAVGIAAQPVPGIAPQPIMPMPPPAMQPYAMPLQQPHMQQYPMHMQPPVPQYQMPLNQAMSQYPIPMQPFPMPIQQPVMPQYAMPMQHQPMPQFTQPSVPPQFAHPMIHAPNAGATSASITAQSPRSQAPTATTKSTVSTTTFVMRSNMPDSQSTRVQFYDHQNKFHKNYEAPAQTVQMNPQDPNQLSAMEHARMENQLRQLRELELDKLRKLSDNRGQRALAREQVRRDCAELTEKLDALTQSNPQILPSDANFIPSHRFTDMAARRETKMNDAMEQILLQPAIITCPEVEPIKITVQSKNKSSQVNLNVATAVNVGAKPKKRSDDAATATSDSCCSVLLDYVDDQTKQLRKELGGTAENSLKAEKLKNLLQRIEKIRAHLLKELKEKSGSTLNDGNVQQVIDSIRKERSDILEDKARTLDARESDLQQKEALLEQRLREFYHEKNKAPVTSSEDSNKTHINLRGKDNNKPLEIIIKVKSDGSIKQYLPKSKSRCQALCKGAPAKEAAGEPVQAQTSYDSNSTSYRSLPAVLYNGFAKTTSDPKTEGDNNAAAPLHPDIAKYVQRLLGMSRNSIDELGVSSTDVPTPNSSIINNSRNLSTGPTTSKNLIDEQRVERVQAFINDNRSFINELEESLVNQSQQNAETSLRAFDQIWKNRLEKSSKSNFSKPPKKPLAQRTIASEATSRPTALRKTTPRETAPQEAMPKKITSRPSTARRSVTIAPNSTIATTAPPVQASQMVHQVTQTQVTTTSDANGTRTTETQQRRQLTQRSAVASSAPGKLQVNNDSAGLEASRQMERYAKLTENCTQRIAELTDLITKVREEKQRLVEVTLTSVSEGERHSTEYFDLPPPATAQPRSRTISDRSDAQYTQNTTPTTSEALPLSDPEPLQKHKPTGASRDSGISVSRPHTAQGQLPELEPMSLTSSTQSSTQRRPRAPPPTMRRYSPQLGADDMAHELSTIAEVDTPAQSHLTGEVVGNATLQRREPVPFPTFEQYAREMELDLTQLNPDQSYRLEQEFNEMVKAMSERGLAINYCEFPSINAYLENATTVVQADTPQTGQPPTAKELLQDLRVTNLSMRAFPSRREYLKHRMAKQPPEERELIDSASLENLSDTTDSFNVEAELRQRRILKSCFLRSDATAAEDANMASSTRRGSAINNDVEQQPNESGIEQLPGSPFGNLSSDIDREMQRLGLHWPTTMRQRQRQADALGSDTTASPEQRSKQLRGGQEQHTSGEEPVEVSKLGRSLNLREFLTRELLKHRAQSSNSADTSDDSLKSDFLRSVIDSLSPAAHGTGATNDRQKTSTPVGSHRTTAVAEQSDSMQTCQSEHGSQLFSAETQLSSVHSRDDTSPLPHEPQQPATKQKTATRS